MASLRSAKVRWRRRRCIFIWRRKMKPAVRRLLCRTACTSTTCHLDCTSERCTYTQAVYIYLYIYIIWGNKKKRHCTLRRRWKKSSSSLGKVNFICFLGECTHFLKCNYPDKANAHMQRCAPPPRRAPTPPQHFYIGKRGKSGRSTHPPTHPPAAARIDHTSCTKCVCCLSLFLGFRLSQLVISVYV